MLHRSASKEKLKVRLIKKELQHKHMRFWFDKEEYIHHL